MKNGKNGGVHKGKFWRLHLQNWNGELILAVMFNEGNERGKAEPFLTLPGM